MLASASRGPAASSKDLTLGKGTASTEHVGVMRGLVEGGVSLGEWKDKLLHDPTLLMEAYLACAHRPAGVPLKR